MADSTTTKEGQNEYLVLVNKKIRSLKKKLNNIAAIEKKITEKAQINDEQKKLLEGKRFTEKSLADLEKIRDQMLKIYQEEEKIQKRLKKKETKEVQPVQKEEVPKEEPVKETKEEETKEKEETQKLAFVHPLIDLFHFVELFDDSRQEGEEARKVLTSETKATLGVNEIHFEALLYLTHLIIVRQPNLGDSFDHAKKYLENSEELFGTYGISYKNLHQIVEYAASNRSQATKDVHHEEQQTENVAAENATETSTDIESPDSTAQPSSAVEGVEGASEETGSPSDKRRQPRGRGGRGRPRGGRQNWDQKGERSDRPERVDRGAQDNRRGSWGGKQGPRGGRGGSNRGSDDKQTIQQQ